jgi:hypothetical protein
MERIDVYRGSEATDEDGNIIQGRVKLWNSFQGLVAPVTVPETPSEISLGVTYDHTIYIRSADPTGILDTDLIGVRGRRVPVDGAVAVWNDTHGKHVGDVINVKLKEG